MIPRKTEGEQNNRIAVRRTDLRFDASEKQQMRLLLIELIKVS